MEKINLSKKRILLNYAIKSREKITLLCKSYAFFQKRKYQKLHDIVIFPIDLISIMSSYRDVFGGFPNIIIPKTFSEWMQWKKTFGRKYFHVACADKINVRNFVGERIGFEYLPKLLWSGIPSEINTDLIESFPQEFVIKSSHGSGMTRIVYDKNNIDIEKLKSETRQWLDTDFSLKHGEWQYRWIKPKIMIEEFLKTRNSKPPVDYKFYCFNGEIVLCNIHLGRFDIHRNLFFDKEFNMLPISNNKNGNFRIDSSEVITKEMFYELINISEKLSEGFHFVRVDLYYTDRPYFGELTFTPAAGLRKFYPEAVDRILGDIYAGKATIEDLYQIKLTTNDVV